MARTSLNKVKGIIQVNTNLDVNPFISSAHALTNWLASVDNENMLDDNLLIEIESYLAAHFYAHRDQLYRSRQTGRASAEFQVETGLILKSTQYGQTAMLLDVTGKLAKRSLEAETGLSVKPRVFWLGNPKDSRRPDCEGGY